MTDDYKEDSMEPLNYDTDADADAERKVVSKDDNDIDDEIDNEIDDEIDNEIDDEIDDDIDNDIEDEIDNDIDNDIEDEIDNDIDDEVVSNDDDDDNVVSLSPSQPPPIPSFNNVTINPKYIYYLLGFLGVLLFILGVVFIRFSFSNQPPLPVPKSSNYDFPENDWYDWYSICNIYKKSFTF